MARYTGPRRRVLRRLGTELSGLTRKTAEARPHPPGQHGRKPRRRRESDYAVRLREKQKVRYHYGVTEKQLRNYMRRAARSGEPTVELLRLLERRLDNVVFRIGLAPTIPAARQLVRHRHILVNGRRVSAPGYQVDVGDEVVARAPSRAHPRIVEGASFGPELIVPRWLERARDGFGGRMIGQPERSEIPLDVNERLIVEFYAR
ncbi:MAG TPA: 30S ribosomal protein S4 [Kofleriaceae bacterium]